MEGALFCGKCGTRAGAGPSQKAAVVTTALAHVAEFFLQKPEFASCKIFDGLYTDVAVSESGYLGFYRPFVPAMPTGMFGKTPVQPEYFEFFHVNQINDIDLNVDERIEVNATGGKADAPSTVMDLIIHTKDFSNPRHVIPLYRGSFSDGSLNMYIKPPSFLKARDAAYQESKKGGKGFLKTLSTGGSVIRDVYNNGEPPVDRVDELTSAIYQIIAAHAEQQSSAANPQFSTADELLKFKQLLDAGAITQEEFDAKKRQLIG